MDEIRNSKLIKLVNHDLTLLNGPVLKTNYGRQNIYRKDNPDHIYDCGRYRHHPKTSRGLWVTAGQNINHIINKDSLWYCDVYIIEDTKYCNKGNSFDAELSFMRLDPHYYECTAWKTHI